MTLIEVGLNINEKLPLGFRFAAGYAGIRKTQTDDLALMASDRPAAAAGLFTRNAVRAACVDLTAKHLAENSGRARGIVCNAGNANCAVSNAAKVSKRAAKDVAAVLEVERREVLVASTGVIGEPLDPEKIAAKLPELAGRLAPDGFEAAARAIMTTDTVPKTAFAEIQTEQGPIRIAGMAKGAGMIQPNMATMLGFLFTDADLGPKPLRRMLREAADESFNRISIDSDTSTNDMLLLLANGASGVRPRGADRDAFRKALVKVCERLAVAVVRDGEGARKLLTIYVDGAPSDRDAVRIAREIANSPLVKTALAGADPNWGRVLPAAGKAGVPFKPEQVDIFLNGEMVCSRGVRAEFDEAAVQKTMEGPESVLRFHLRGGGAGEARFWTCDFTEDYIRINAEYRT